MHMSVSVAVAGASGYAGGEVLRRGKVSWPIGFSGSFNGSLSGEENCRFVARIYGQDVDYLVDFTREFADIGRYFFEPVKTYSSGMGARQCRRLVVARATSRHDDRHGDPVPVH